jgi:hypothetical protein
MRSRQDIEAYLIRSGAAYEEPSEDTWIIHDRDSGEKIVVRIEDDLVVFRVKVLELASVTRREELFRRLLELNAEEMVHCAYGIVDDAVVLTASLQLENLDYNEFQGAIDEVSLALSGHYETLASFRTAA